MSRISLGGCLYPLLGRSGDTDADVDEETSEPSRGRADVADPAVIEYSSQQGGVRF